MVARVLFGVRRYGWRLPGRSAGETQELERQLISRRRPTFRKVRETAWGTAGMQIDRFGISAAGSHFAHARQAPQLALTGQK